MIIAADAGQVLTRRGGAWTPGGWLDDSSALESVCGGPGVGRLPRGCFEQSRALFRGPGGAWACSLTLPAAVGGGPSHRSPPGLRPRGRAVRTGTDHRHRVKGADSNSEGLGVGGQDPVVPEAASLHEELPLWGNAWESPWFGWNLGSALTETILSHCLWPRSLIFQ